MGILNVLSVYLGLNPSGRRVEDEYTIYAKDRDGYYFEMEHDHSDPMCNMMLSKGHGWRVVRESEIPHYIKEKLCEPVPV